MLHNKYIVKIFQVVFYFNIFFRTANFKIKFKQNMQSKNIAEYRDIHCTVAYKFKNLDSNLNFTTT